MERIYLATPYTDPSPAIRQERFRAVTLVAGALMRQGHIVFSPITMGHSISKMCADLPVAFDFWERSCLSWLEGWATTLNVLMLEGWESSRGVTAEIAAAQQNGLTVRFLEPCDFCKYL